MNTQFFPQSIKNDASLHSQDNNAGRNALLMESEDGEEKERGIGRVSATTSKMEELGGFHSGSFEEHSKIQTITPSESLVDFPLHFQPPQEYPEGTIFFQPSQREVENRLNQQIAYLREENLYLKEQLEQIKANYQQYAKNQQQSRPVYSNQDVNRLIEDNHSLEDAYQHLTAQVTALKQEIAHFQQNLKEISNSNQEFYKRVVSLTNELERERKESRAALKEVEERSAKIIEQQQRRYSAAIDDLTAQREENQNLRTIVDESNEEMQRLKKMYDQLQEECESLIAEKQELKDYYESGQNQSKEREVAELREALQGRREEMEQMRGELQGLAEDYDGLLVECSNWKDLYQKQLMTSQQKEEIIASLKQELQRVKRPQRPPFMHQPSFHHTLSPSSTQNNAKRMSRQPEGNSTCSASTANRLKVLCNQSTRKNIMVELKRSIKEIAKVDLENKITSLVHQLYMDAEYRERTNLQMQEIIVQLETKIAQLERVRPEPIKKQGKLHSNSEAYISHLEQSLSRYERLLLNADSEKLKLMDELAVLKKENYQVRLQLANSQLDTETEQLIQQLTLQLEQEKHSARTLQEENDHFKNEIITIEKELHEKNKRIKLLMLNLNKKNADPHLHHRPQPFS